MSHEDHQTLPNAIRARRKQLALTQEQLGDFAGCGRLFVHELEKGKPTVRLDKLMAVMRVLGLQLSIENGTKNFVDNSHASD